MSIKKLERPLKSGEMSVKYQAVVSLPNRKQMTKLFDRKIDATNWETEQKAQISKGLSVSFEGNSLKFADAAERWMEDHAKVRKSYAAWIGDQRLLKLHILPEFGDVVLSAINPRAVEIWINRLSLTKSPKTVNHCIGLLKKVLNDHVRWGAIPLNPIAYVRPLKLVKAEMLFWSRDEIVKFLTALKSQALSYYATFVLALNTGMRVGEIRALKWSNIDFDRGIITISASYSSAAKALKSTKNGKIRQAPINSALKAVLVELRQSSNGEFVIDPVGLNNTAKVMDRLCKLAGVKRIRFHDLRHTFASEFMRMGRPMFELQNILGHSAAHMTDHYSHMSADNLIGTTDGLNFAAEDEGTENVIQLVK